MLLLSPIVRQGYTQCSSSSSHKPAGLDGLVVFMGEPAEEEEEEKASHCGIIVAAASKRHRERTYGCSRKPDLKAPTSEERK
jgi:hypothetical protein